MSADQNPIDGLEHRAKILDVCVTGNGAAQGLPVGNNQSRAFDDCARPTEFLCSANLKPLGIEGDSPGLNLLDGHAPILWFLSVFVRELDEVDEVSFQERNAATSRVDDFLSAEVEAVPNEQVDEHRDRKEGGCALRPCGRGRRVGRVIFDQRAASIPESSSILERLRFPIPAARQTEDPEGNFPGLGGPDRPVGASPVITRRIRWRTGHSKSS